MCDVMDATYRREKIFEMIKQHQAPLSASSLAKTFNVSRQVIVGDVALLRARGHEIVATARGYIMPTYENQYIGAVVCRHAPEHTAAELYAIVDTGATVVNIVIEHDLYGEIIGNLNLSGRSDVDVFINAAKASKNKLLSELTMGMHLHTISCRDAHHFEQVCRALSAKGFLHRACLKNL